MLSRDGSSFVAKNSAFHDNYTAYGKVQLHQCQKVFLSVKGLFNACKSTKRFYILRKMLESTVN